MEYTAIVSKIKVRKHPNADKLQIGAVCNVDVIVGLDVKEGDLGLYFAPDGQLSEEFAKANDLVGYRDPDTGEKKGGYFGKNRRVKAQTFRGVPSYGFWIPIDSIDKIALLVPHYKLCEGDKLDVYAGTPICNKYITPATMQALRGKRGRAKRANANFAKHFDTAHLDKSIHSIPKGSIIYFTEKVHGTSQRTGYVLDKYTHRRTLWQAFLCGFMGMGFSREVESERYTTITGTRNVVLKEYQTGYYGNEEFRGIMENKVKGLLKKGEILYYEVVGNTTTGKSIMSSVSITDKALRKFYAKTMQYSYGCKENACEMYVYRITNVNEDGVAVDLSWPMVMSRCEELGVQYVPNLVCGTWTNSDGQELHAGISYSKSDPIVYDGDSESLLYTANIFAQGPSTLDSSHIREGVVTRVENGEGVKCFKLKSHDFLVLEGIVKDKDDYVDIEESS